MAKSIMIVDDAPGVRKMAFYTIKQGGYAVHEAKDGKDALDKLSRVKVDMLITDLSMPNLDGIALIQQVRRMPQYKFMPILLLTTAADQERKPEAKPAGATGALEKPFQPDQLLSAVKKLVR